MNRSHKISKADIASFVCFHEIKAFNLRWQRLDSSGVHALPLLAFAYSPSIPKSLRIFIDFDQ